MHLAIPEPLTLEHQSLHKPLAEAARLEGALGDPARVVARILHPHFVREEQIALPPLNLLKLTLGRRT